VTDPEYDRNHPVRVVVGLSAAALTGAWWWTFTGPYRWIAERWLAASDHYYPVVVGVLTYLVAGVPLLALEWVLRRHMNRHGEGPLGARLRAFSEFLERYPRLMPWAVVGFGLMLAGGLEWAGGAALGEAGVIDVAALERGEEPGAKWGTVEGNPVYDLAVDIDGDDRIFLLPFVSADWDGGPIALFIEVQGEDEGLLLPYGEKQPPWVLEGALKPTGLPGEARAVFAGSPVPQPREDHRVLDLAATPDALKDDGELLAFGGLLIFILAGGLLYIDRQDTW